MSNLDTFMERNQDFVDRHFVTGLQMMPTLRTAIISCLDPRVDPTHVLGLKLGEAVVIRNIGGRVTPSTLETITMLKNLAHGQGTQPAGAFNVIVFQHTDCGIIRLQEKPDLLTDYFQVDKAELQTKAIADPWNAVAIDIATLRSQASLPGNWRVSGLVYDVSTGHAHAVELPENLQ